MGAVSGAMLVMKYLPTQDHNTKVGGIAAGALLGGLAGYYSTAEQVVEMAEEL
jgi:hypothetical protein